MRTPLPIQAFAALALVGTLTLGPARSSLAQAPLTGSAHDGHRPRSAPAGEAGAPTLPGQDAFAAIAEVVSMLDADPGTDWRTVNIEALREQLRDMDDVVMLSEVSQGPVPGGLTIVVVGYGRTIGAIKRMVGAHAAELARVPGWRVTSEPLPRGVRLTVAAGSTAAGAAARIRALGFAGLLTVGAHHQAHHLAIARGGAHLERGDSRTH